MPARAAIYLDANAGSPLKPEVIQAVQAAISSGMLANPSSIHAHGRKAKRWMAEARESIAASLGSTSQVIDPEQLVFTSSGSEANQLAIRSEFEAARRESRVFHWITTPVEHDSTLQMVDWVRAQGGQVDFLPVDEQGRPRADRLSEMIRPETRLLSVVWVNNETGVITELSPLIEEARRNDVRVHIDGAQAWGKLPIALDGLSAHWVSFSAHKIGALSGTGVLWVGRGNTFESLVRGKQEKGRRGGTENLLGIVAAGAAARLVDPAAWSARVGSLRDELQGAISERIPGTIVNGAEALRVANTLSLNFEGIEGDGMIMALDLAGFSVSSGSACSSGAIEPSHVLLAMGRSREQARSAVRVSLGDAHSLDELHAFVDALAEVVGRMRRGTPFHVKQR